MTDSDLLKSLDLHPEATREGGAEVGDVVWLAKRRKQPDVSVFASFFSGNRLILRHWNHSLAGRSWAVCVSSCEINS